MHGHNVSVRVEECDIDRLPHEPGVNGAAARDHQVQLALIVYAHEADEAVAKGAGDAEVADIVTFQSLLPPHGSLLMSS